MIRKLLINDGASERVLVLVGTVTVGRDPACHISGIDPLLSRRHAEFLSTPENVVLRDLGSRNGVLVNGTKVPRHVMSSGDVVQLGHLQLLYVEEESVPAAPVEAPAEMTSSEAPTMAPAGWRSTAAADLEDTKAGSSPAASPVDAADVTRMPGSLDVDATFAPGLDPDATFAPTTAVPAAHAQHSSAAESSDAVRREDATLIAGPDLVVTAADRAFREMLGLHPDALVGGQLSDVLAQALASLAAGNGPPALSVAIVRGSSDRTLTITFRAGQAIETVR